MLGVHVLGPGYGESIIVELPGDEVGVIDSFASPHRDPPTLEFLRTKYPNLTSLKFVALTHPHADHCVGMYRYFEVYSVKEFWAFHSFIQHTCMGFFKAMFEKGTADAVEDALDFPPGTVWLDALRLKEALDQQKNPVKIRWLISGRCVDLSDGRVAAKLLTPSDAAMWRYDEILAKAVKSLMKDGPSLDPTWDPCCLPHNQASGAILFEYGQTRILLMADAEDDLWCDLIGENGDNGLPNVDFIKGSHHGSANGFNAEIYASAANKNTVLVITPFNRHRFPLPTSEGIGHIRPHVRELYCTNSVEACKSSGLPWQNTMTGPSLSVPPEWVVACRANPKLLSLLADQQSMHPYSAGSVPVPRRWFHDCQKKPELIQLLCSELRNSKVVGPRPHLNDEFRVSISYDDSGRIIDKYLGWGVGYLPGLHDVIVN